MNTHVMLDLETFGNRPGSVIVAIGAVKFADLRVDDSFYARIDPESCVAIGLKMDTSTVLWWLKQAEPARLELVKPGWGITAALLHFAQWLADPNAEVWGNGASFDNVLLADAYDRAGMPRPWKYYNDRCYRTVKNLRPDIVMPRSGTHHNALDDATSQAIHLMSVFAAMAAPKVEVPHV